MPKLHDYPSYAGKTFNNFLLIKDLGFRINASNYKRRYFLINCLLCNQERESDVSQIITGKMKSCRCIAGIKHGHRFTRLYGIWLNMKSRCNWPKNKCYHHYGGRGIKVCKEWSDDFMNFHEWALKSGYAEKLEIDRINNDGNYEPGNCKWSTRTEQMNNNRRNVFYLYKGKMMSPKQIEIETGIKFLILYKRMKRNNISLETAISIPRNVKVKYFLNDNNCPIQK